MEHRSLAPDFKSVKFDENFTKKNKYIRKKLEAMGYIILVVLILFIELFPSFEFFL
jgi:hypothetical protein